MCSSAAAVAIFALMHATSVFGESVYCLEDGSDCMVFTNPNVCMVLVQKVVCVGDLTGDGEVKGEDLGIVLGSWNTADPLADMNDDGTVDGIDLSLILGGWGLCP